MITLITVFFMLLTYSFIKVYRVIYKELKKRWPSKNISFMEVIIEEFTDYDVSSYHASAAACAVAVYAIVGFLICATTFIIIINFCIKYLP